MAQLKEMNGKYYGLTDVVMLPSNERTISHIQPWLHHGKLMCSTGPTVTVSEKEIEIKYCVPQHLYFLSDERPKDGEWVLNKWNEVHQITKNDGKEYIKTCKKIITTTNDSLTYQIPCPDGIIGCEVGHYRLIPQPSHKFIKRFVEAFNNGNPITKALVEYTRHGFGTFNMSGFTQEIDYKLKVDEDNFITIQKEKNNFTRQEVIDFVYLTLKACGKEIKADMVNISTNPHLEFTGVDKFIEENL